MALRNPSTITVEEYFALEENEPEARYEYVDGYIYAMSGGSINHGTIGFNIQRVLWNLLRGTPCRVFNSDLKVRISEMRYFHPDVTVSCDPRNQGKNLIVESPRVIFEVLSPSTEVKDRGQKLRDYLACPTVEAYLLVNQNVPRIEIYGKENATWYYDVFNAGDEVELPNLGIHFPIEEVYADVDFPEISEEDEDES
ncbi:MAG: Uma2 family endonuclease [Ktedonobacteraceae bacterium]